MKYYTPSLEEFHIGFEYEYRDLCGWHSEEFSSFDTYDGDGAMVDWCPREDNLERFRVKFLDEQDFIDLGFIKSETDSLGYIYFTKSSYTIAYYPPTIFIEIDNEESPFQKFIGTIKNKSELIKLLTQLGL